jgi:hypothetical protein
MKVTKGELGLSAHHVLVKWVVGGKGASGVEDDEGKCVRAGASAGL